MNELQLLWTALVLYVVAGSAAIFSVVWRRRPERLVLALMVFGLALHTASIAVRWERLGHGPYVTMFEILSSNIWSLMLAFAIVYWRMPTIRATAAVVMPILFIMMGWMLMTNPGDGNLPSSYHTVWLFIHIGFGKVFLGATLVAVGLAGVILARRTARGLRWFVRLPEDTRLDDLAYRCMALGFIFESLMLVAGAIWAQDAWGRYWAWDPKETWSLVVWATYGGYLYWHYLHGWRGRRMAWWAIAGFALAVFGVLGVNLLLTRLHGYA